MVDADGRDGGARVPTAAFSRLSATNVLFGWTWPQMCFSKLASAL